MIWLALGAALAVAAVILFKIITANETLNRLVSDERYDRQANSNKEESK